MYVQDREANPAGIMAYRLFFQREVRIRRNLGATASSYRQDDVSNSAACQMGKAQAPRHYVRMALY